MPQSTSRRIIGLDLSLARTGWAAWGDDGFESYANFITKPAQLLELRIESIWQWLLQSLNQSDYDLLCIENQAFGARFKDGRVIELGGVVKQELWRLEVPYALISPQAIKKHATGSGNAKKEQMLAAARRIDAQIPNHDVADALWAASYGWYHYDDLVESAG